MPTTPKPGQEAKITYVRDGKMFTITATSSSDLDPQNTRATPCCKVVDDGFRPRVEPRPCEHGRFTRAEIPRLDHRRNGSWIEHLDPGRSAHRTHGHVVRTALTDLARHRCWNEHRLTHQGQQIEVSPRARMMSGDEFVTGGSATIELAPQIVDIDGKCVHLRTRERSQKICAIETRDLCGLLL